LIGRLNIRVTVVLGKQKGFIIACLCVITLCSKAGEDNNLKKLEGIYTYSFHNGLMNGKKYISRNKLQLLQVAASAAYFNVHLEWANGHVCNVSGVAQVEANEAELVYRKPSIDGKVCKLTIESKQGGIEIGDEAGACRLVSCGTRGRLDGVQFSFKSRAKIRRDSVRQSPDFVRAWEEYNQQNAKPSDNTQ
jgi:hypothetical protein